MNPINSEASSQPETPSQPVTVKEHESTSSTSTTSEEFILSKVLIYFLLL